MWLAAKGRREPIVLNYQGDMPLLKPATLRATVAALTRGADIATAVIPAAGKRCADPNVVKAVLAKDGSCLYFSRSKVPHDRDGAAAGCWEHLGLYAYRRDALRRFVALPPSPLERREKLEQLRALEAGMRIDVTIVDSVPLGVDTPGDLEIARAALQRGR